MSDLTKQALIASFKKLLETEPFDKITISDITNDCGLSRQTFYYHFRDIFDMIRWIYNSESLNEIGGRGGYGTWQDKIRELFDYTLNNKSLILGTFNSKCRNDLVGYYMDVSIRKTVFANNDTFFDKRGSSLLKKYIVICYHQI